MQYIILGGGCFWCLEAVYNKTKGVVSAISGYSGGATENPTYREVCSGQTGHAEVVKVEFDENIVDLETILNIFWTIHDPTSLNKQGADEGTQYRSVIFYHDLQQLEVINKSINKLTEENIYDKPIVTQIKEEEMFYIAEEYHQRYFEKNPFNGYCQAVVNPKVVKFKKKFSLYIKD